jgi:hypothetical protein
MPLSTRRSFARRMPRDLFGSIGLMAVHSKSLRSRLTIRGPGFLSLNHVSAINPPWPMALPTLMR